MLITIKDGQIVGDSLDIESLKDGNYEVKFKRIQDLRTARQNNYLHAVFAILGKELGYSTEEMKDLIKSMFLKKTTVLKFQGKRKRITKVGETSKLDKKEFSHFFEKIKAFADYMGIKIPNPELYQIEIFYNL